MNQSALAIGLVAHPLSIVFGSVLPDLLSIAILHAHEYLSSVYGSVRQSDRAESLSELGVLHLWGDSGVALVLVKVVGRHHLFGSDWLTIHLVLLLRVVLIILVHTHVCLLLLLKFLSVGSLVEVCT
jgi:hypothetical protein